MKYLVISVSFLFCAPAFAASSDNYSGDIMSLNYYTHEGMMRLNAQSRTSLGDSTSNSNGGGNQIFYNGFSLGLSYGLLPKLRLAVSESLLWDQSVEGSANSSLSNGPSDPSLTLAWRFLEDNATGLSGDIAGILSPSVGASIPANPASNVTGNNLNGFSSAAVQLSLFWRFADNEIALTGNADRHFQGQVDGIGDANTVSVSPLWAYNFSLADRLHLGNRVFLGVSFQHTKVGDTIKNGADGTQKVVNHEGYWNYSAEFGYRPEPYYCFILSVSTQKSSTTTTQANTTSLTTNDNNTFGQLFFLHQFRL